MCYLEWCGLCYENMRGRANHKGHRHYHAPKAKRKGWESWQMYVKRKVESAGGPAQRATDPEFEKKYPALWEYLSLTLHEDGTTRQLSKMSLNIVEGRWSVYFADASSGCGAFLSGTSFLELLKSLEKHLAADTLEWRKMPDWAKRKGK